MKALLFFLAFNSTLTLACENLTGTYLYKSEKNQVVFILKDRGCEIIPELTVLERGSWGESGPSDSISLIFSESPLYSNEEISGDPTYKRIYRERNFFGAVGVGITLDKVFFSRMFVWESAPGKKDYWIHEVAGGSVNAYTLKKLK